MNDQNNENKRNGSYKARLHLSVDSTHTSALKNATHKKNVSKKLRKCDERLVKKFTAFILISDVNMIIDSAFRSDIHFQLCVGKKKIKFVYDLKEPVLNSFLFTKKGTNGYNNEVTTNSNPDEKPVKLDPSMAAYIPYEKSKPCLSIEFSIQDMRHLMFSRNFLLKSLKVLVGVENYDF